MDLDAVMPEYRDGRFGDERVVVVGEDIAEIRHARAAPRILGRSELSRPAAAPCSLQEAPRSKPRQPPMARKTDQALQHPADDPAGKQGVDGQGKVAPQG